MLLTTNQTLPGGNYLIISGIPAGDRKIVNLFLQCARWIEQKAIRHKKKGKALRKFSFLLPRFPPLNLFHRVENPAYQFICEGRHVAEPRNHGNHSRLVPTARTNHRSYPVFFIIKRVWFLKGSVARAFYYFI